MSKETILGYRIDTRSATELAAEIVVSPAAGPSGTWLACFNPHSYAVARDDSEFSNALRSATYLVPDGVGAVWASRILGGKLRRRVTGFDIFAAVHELGGKVGGLRVFFLGSTQDTLQKIRKQLALDYPDVTVAGTYSPPYKPEFDAADTEAMIQSVNASRAHVLWVGMTAPKQEKWIAQTIDRLDVRFAAGIGAVFDFYVGNVRRSHPMFRSVGLEWLPRLLREPRRLWRRTFVSAPLFVRDVLCDRLGRRGKVA